MSEDVLLCPHIWVTVSLRIELENQGHFSSALWRWCSNTPLRPMTLVVGMMSIWSISLQGYCLKTLISVWVFCTLPLIHSLLLPRLFWPWNEIITIIRCKASPFSVPASITEETDCSSHAATTGLSWVEAQVSWLPSLLCPVTFLKYNNNIPKLFGKSW